MRTKTLLLSAAVLAAGLAASVAQSVYSVNAVGYVNLTLGPGYSLISNPLNGTNNNLSTVLPTPPDGTYVLKWDPATQSFLNPFNYLDGVGWLPDTTVNPGEGVFINLPPGSGNVTLTFVGEVPQGALTNRISGNYSLLASVVPQQIALDAPEASFPVQDGDYVLFWNPATQAFDNPINYLDGVGWLPSAPTPAVGQAFFYFTGSGASRLWTRNFSVN
jgi:hypothetical protein